MNIDHYTYPCTGNIGIEGFGQFLEQEIADPRRNLRLFARELGDLLGEGDPLMARQLTLVNSGSSACLVAALTLAEELRRQRRPLTAVASAFTFPTTLSALLLAGFSVKLIDVGAGDYKSPATDCKSPATDFNLSVPLLEAETEAPSLVCVTHFLGFPADLVALDAYRRRTGCLLMQDACETMTAHIGNVPLYRFGDVVCWSFYHPHHLSSYGGGAVYCAPTELHVLADSIAHWGRACKCHIDERLCHVPQGPAHQFTYEHLGVNVEMSELNACFGRWQLRQWPDIEQRRRSNYTRLLTLLQDVEGLHVWPFYNDQHDSPFVFPILLRHATIDEAWRLLSPQGIELRTLMGGATCDQPAFHAKTIAADNSHAQWMSRHCFFVGCHHTLSLAAVEHVGNTIARTLSGRE